MASPFIGEIKMFGGNFAINGWAFCQGQLLAISQNAALFALLGTTYGGNGTTTFGLPDLRGRIPVGQGQGPGLANRSLGEVAGTESVTVTSGQMPIHTHVAACSTAVGTSTTPAGNYWAANANTGLAQYAATPNALMNPATVSNVGGSIPHENRMPYLGINFIIALQGVFPSRN